VAVGFVQDPDADRLALIDETGRYIGEEYTLVLAAKSVLDHRPGPLATNLSTSRMIDDVAAAAGTTVFRTPVGEANVAAAIGEHQCVLGGEGNGGVIDPRVVPVRDSLTGIALIADLLARTGKPLGKLVADLPRYHMVKKKLPLPADGVASMLKRVAAAGAGGTINDSDGVRIDWPAGWVHVRASNTEPACRVIAEARDEVETNKILQRVAGAIGPAGR
jgi:phosphomannomutase